MNAWQVCPAIEVEEDRQAHRPQQISGEDAEWPEQHQFRLKIQTGQAQRVAGKKAWHRAELHIGQCNRFTS